MATFKYVAKDQEARTVSGKMAADDQNVVIEELRKRKLTIISIEEDKKLSTGKKVTQRARRVKSEDLVVFTRQLATMIDAGIPIIQAIDALQEQTTNPSFKSVVVQIRDDIQLGTSLSAAFAKHNQVFDVLYINMIRVGETGGVLTAILERISTYLEKTAALMRKVKSALIYPAVIVSMALVITTVLIVKVVPTFASIYSSFGKELPFMTQMLIDFSTSFSKMLPFYIAFIVLSVFLLIRFHKTEKGGLIIDRQILRIPIFGDLITKVSISRFSRTLATLMQSGVPILESLEIVGKTCGNKLLEKVVEGVQSSVREGEGIAGPLSKSEVFPPMVTRMIAIGEKSGQMEKMLVKISEFYDDQVDAAVTGLTSLIEPIIIGVLGVVVGFIVIALFMPIINITQIING